MSAVQMQVVQVNHEVQVIIFWQRWQVEVPLQVQQPFMGAHNTQLPKKAMSTRTEELLYYII